MSLHIETPLLESLPMSLATQKNVWLKMEALQPSGSFKIRGIGFACQTYAQQGATRFISSSGGNAGLAVAYAGRKLGITTTVVVPQTTSAHAIELLEQEQASVIVHGASWQEANEHALSLLGPKDAFLHPFDDPLLWQGHASIMDEIAAAQVKPDAVILSVGGGGLLAGVVEGLQRLDWHDVPVVAVETVGAGSFNAAINAGHTVDIGNINTVATSLGARRVSEHALACAKEHPIHSLLVSDEAAVTACQRFLADHRMLVEPACGASLACAYDNHPVLTAYNNIAVIVCGGSTITVDKLLSLSMK